MFALVTDGSITKYFSGKRGITLGDIQYPQAIFSLWSKSEKEAIGIYEVEIDTTNRKDEEWYVNTNITYSFGGGKVTGAYGSATAKAHANTLFTAQDETDGLGTEGEVKTEGLKTKLIRTVKAQAAGILQDTDWYIVRKTDAGTAVPSAITTHRAAVRTKCASMETAITNASDTPALETLYAYVNTADEGDPEVFERPLGELPTL